MVGITRFFWFDVSAAVETLLLCVGILVLVVSYVSLEIGPEVEVTVETSEVAVAVVVGAPGWGEGAPLIAVLAAAQASLPSVVPVLEGTRMRVLAPVAVSAVEGAPVCRS
ncbi:MAG: hypothetical protein KVP17_003735 [Porospora cf. gigantea B]|uniref:uncharacterized protein n=1 Tax=Porospora cf. gigantea B TaxID=2853592 RepID=UPI003571FA06|nr:MAG: hypothetical protein KVP17_003735 [Porospora cf. gigantea B]